jgi:pimeloyl-ACP methyl ester carboxylesterase
MRRKATRAPTGMWADVVVGAVHHEDRALHERAQLLERLAELTGGSLVTVDGGGHGPQGRDTVLVNRLVKQFVLDVAPPPR